MAGLYIHIPFCGRRCAYCDFYSTTSPERVAAFLEAAKREMTTKRSFFERSPLSTLPPSAFPAPPLCGDVRASVGEPFNFQLSTIYIGGGTPSLLRPEQLRGLLDHAVTLWDCTPLREVTLEANPEDLTNDYLARLCKADSSPSVRNDRAGEPVRNNKTSGLVLCHPEGSEATRDLPLTFNRLSIGVQSFDDGLLRLMNRRHNAARAREAVRAAQRAGFDNISIDLIYGIPGMTDAQWERSLDEATALGVQHISAYHLTIEPGTAFGRQGLREVTDQTSERQFARLREKLGEAGFEHYEISNFAQPGRRAVHNSAYWTGEPYLGVGPSAHSFDGDRRREWVVADLERYISAPAYEGETLTDREIANERVMTGLRTAEGIDLLELRIMNYELRIAVERFLRDGLLVRENGRVAIPPERWLLADHIIGMLFRVD